MLLLPGHFTQVVWKDTKEMGIAYALYDQTDSKGNVWHKIAVICDYSPSGNYRGEEFANVPPLVAG
jgi:hypothetical protein